MKKILSAVFLALAICAHAQVTDVLFVGNSYTYSNNLPEMVRQLAIAAGDTLNHDSSAPGGYTFQMHTQNTTTQAKINAQPWEFVVLQAQSQEPSLDTAYVLNNVYPFATTLVNLVEANDACTQVIFFMTWGRKNGDSQNCAAYPPVCTFAGMQQQLRGRYLDMANGNGAIVAPVGEAWKNVIALNPAFDLYSADESHPSVHGTYLAACVFYATIYRQSPAGLSYYGGLTQSDALLLQTVAGSTVLDSMQVWNTEIYYPHAAFTAVGAGPNSVSCTATDPSATSWAWNDGTGNGFIAGNSSTTLTWPTAGDYNVCLAVSNGCRVDTFCMEINPATVGVIENGSESQLEISFPVAGSVMIQPMDLQQEVATITLMDAQGKIVALSRTVSGSVTFAGLAPGLYIATAENETWIAHRRFIVPAGR